MAKDKKENTFTIWSKLIKVQVSLAIRGGYVPYKSRTSNTKNSVLGLIYAKNSSFPSLFAVFGDFLSPRIIKTAITKTANSEGRLYVNYNFCRAEWSVKSLLFDVFTRIDTQIAAGDNVTVTPTAA